MGGLDNGDGAKVRSSDSGNCGWDAAAVACLAGGSSKGRRL